VHVSKELVRVALKEHGFTRKRARFFGAPPQLPEKTIEFIKTRDRLLEEGRVFWSLDETSFGRHGRPVYGYSQRGQQLVIKKGCPRFSTTSVIAIADSSGEIAFEKRSGSFDTLSFASFLRRLNIPSESVIILDNVAFHKAKVISEIARQKRWDLLYSPPYSPRFNPIEGIFSIVKRAWYSRSCSIDESFAKVTQDHCSAFFSKAFDETLNPQGAV
jgi:transposase